MFHLLCWRSISFSLNPRLFQILANFSIDFYRYFTPRPSSPLPLEFPFISSTVVYQFIEKPNVPILSCGKLQQMNMIFTMLFTRIYYWLMQKKKRDKRQMRICLLQSEIYTSLKKNRCLHKREGPLKAVFFKKVKIIRTQGLGILECQQTLKCSKNFLQYFYT